MGYINTFSSTICYNIMRYKQGIYYKANNMTSNVYTVCNMKISFGAPENGLICEKLKEFL